MKILTAHAGDESKLYEKADAEKCAKASSKKDAPPFVERIVVVRVEYADGPAWPGQRGR